MTKSLRSIALCSNIVDVVEMLSNVWIEEIVRNLLKVISMLTINEMLFWWSERGRNHKWPLFFLFLFFVQSRILFVILFCLLKYKKTMKNWRSFAKKEKYLLLSSLMSSRFVVNLMLRRRISVKIKTKNDANTFHRIFFTYTQKKSHKFEWLSDRWEVDDRHEIIEKNEKSK